MNKTLVACRGTFFANGEIRIGALQFFDGETNAEAVVYYDTLLTTPAPNPIPIDINGNIPQVYGNKFYKVKQYAIKPTGTSFPADYDEILDFYWDASTSSNGVGSLSFVDTVSALKVLQPANGDSVGLLGYYAKGDARFRVFTFNSTSIDTPNNGNRIRPNGYGAGAWEENSSSVIYASDFGLIGTANANGNMAQLVSWCNGNGVTCVFDKGIYNLTAGSATFSNKVIIEDSAYFNVTGGEFTLALNGVFEVPQKSFGTTLFTLDVSASIYTNPSGLVPEIWGTTTQQLNKACAKCGASGLRIVGTKTLTDTSAFYRPSLSRFVFGNAGKLVNNATIDFVVHNVVIDGRSNEVGLFETSGSTFSNKLSIVKSAKSSWFEVGGESTEKLATALDVNCSLFVDNSLNCSNDVTFSSVNELGGTLTAKGTAIVSIAKCEGSKFLTRTGTAKFSGVQNVDHFILSDEAGIQCFVESNNASANFQGRTTGGNITLNGDITLYNMSHNGTINASFVTAYNCQFKQALTALRVDLFGCFVNGLNVSKYGGFVNVILKGCVVANTITVTSITTDQIDQFIVENCRYTGGGSPLVVTNCLANSRRSGSVINVRNNTPECFADDAVPVGAWAQSYIDTELTMIDDTAPADYNYPLNSKAFALTFPNISVKSGTRMLNSSFVLSGSVCDISSVTVANNEVKISSNSDLSDLVKVRVTGNLY